MNANIAEGEKGLLIKSGKKLKNLESIPKNRSHQYKIRSKRDMSANPNALKNKFLNEIARMEKKGIINSLPKICVDSIFQAKRIKFLQTFLENDKIWFKRGD